MSGRVHVDFAMAPGAVPRMIGLVERRGFDLLALAMDRAPGGEARLLLDVAPRDRGRSLEVLAGQLRRLHEVSSVSFSLPSASLAP
jgi:acetolactate synthase regulatory subunit